MPKRASQVDDRQQPRDAPEASRAQRPCLSASLSDDEASARCRRRSHQLLERRRLLDLERHVRGELVNNVGRHFHLVKGRRHVEEIQHDANTGVSPLERHDPSNEFLDHRIEATAVALSVRLSVQVEPGGQLREVVEEPHLCGHRPVPRELRRCTDRRRDDGVQPRRCSREDEHSAGPNQFPRGAGPELRNAFPGTW